MQPKNYHVEILYLQNKLDKDMQKIIQPFNIFLTLFLSSIYKVKKNYIKPCAKNSQIIIFLIISSINLVDVCIASFTNKFKTFTLTFIICCSLFLLILSYMLLMICNIYFSNNLILLILKLQEIYDTLDINKEIRIFCIWNWILIFSVILFEVLLAILFQIATKFKISVNLINLHIVNVSYDINMLYAIRVMSLLTMLLERCVTMIQFDIDNEEDSKDKPENVFVTFKKILDAYELYNSCFRILVSSHSFLYRLKIEGYQFDLYVCARLSDFDVVFSIDFFPLQIAQRTIEYFIRSLLIIQLNLSTLISAICTYCEKFYKTQEEMQSACLQQIMDSKCSENKKYLCKQVLQLSRTFSKISACGLFTVDASFPMPLMGVMANYIFFTSALCYMHSAVVCTLQYASTSLHRTHRMYCTQWIFVLLV
ncbi:hypothetical protein SFRURICE_016832 [Spodoptera frugiperda]|nr:hypothetical protein SFRURICE_016832 [Spodoptera frugiperda]